MPTAVIQSKSKPEVEFQYGGRLFFETGSSYISAVDWVITTKFGSLIDTAILKRASPNLQPEVKLRRSGRHLENRYNIISSLRMDELDEIRQPNANSHADCRVYCTCSVIWSKSKSEVEFQYGGWLFFQTGNSYNSDVNWAIITKFGLLIDIDLLKRDVSQSESGSKIASQRPQSWKSNRYWLVVAFLTEPGRK